MNDQTMEKMKTMKLHGMVRAFRTSLESGNADTWTADELLSLLVDSEWDDRYNRKCKLPVDSGQACYCFGIDRFIYTVRKSDEF